MCTFFCINKSVGITIGALCHGLDTKCFSSILCSVSTSSQDGDLLYDSLLFFFCVLFQETWTICERSSRHNTNNYHGIFNYLPSWTFVKAYFYESQSWYHLLSWIMQPIDVARYINWTYMMYGIHAESTEFHNFDLAF